MPLNTAKKFAKRVRPDKGTMLNLESPKLSGTSVPTWSKAIDDMTLLAASGRHWSNFEKQPKMPHPTAFFALSLMQCQTPLQLSRLKNIGNVFELSDVAFRLAPPCGELLVQDQLECLQPDRIWSAFNFVRFPSSNLLRIASRHRRARSD